jgi:hypothetical protein
MNPLSELTAVRLETSLIEINVFDWQFATCSFHLHVLFSHHVPDFTLTAWTSDRKHCPPRLK